jgi:hypothetical protein
MSAENKSDTKTYSIRLWEVYNVLDGDDYKCESLFKNGKKCDRKCTMKYIRNNETIHCCKTHFPKEITKTKTHEFKKKTIDSYLLQDIAKAFILRVQEIYDDNPILKQVTTIQIELQPKCNQKMKFTSHVLYGKLVELYKDTNTIIRFVRAATKLKAYTGPPIECKLKGAYAKRKWLGIQYAKWILQNQFNIDEKNKWIHVFDTHTKLDDLNDALLMCVNSLYGTPKMKDKKGKCIK